MSGQTTSQKLAQSKHLEPRDLRKGNQKRQRTRRGKHGVEITGDIKTRSGPKFVTTNVKFQCSMWGFFLG